MTPLEAELRRMIAIDGPMPVARYMALCLGHPLHGYYVTRDPFGAAGDFVTAPEISQMFGELIGLWAASVWQQMGSPASVRLVELGPGRGTLMADALRASKVLPAFHAALSVHLVEVSPALAARQRQAMAETGLPTAWHRDVAEVPDGPTIIIANEFLDALPVHQAVKTDGWHARTVAVDDDRLAFLLAPEALPGFESSVPASLRNVPSGAIYEWRDDRVILELSQRLVRDAGAALLVDYGHVESAAGETLQAVRHHGFVDPLAEPGNVDLTAHVDFAAVARAAARAGARVHGPLTQGDFLARLGIGARAERLRRAATPGQAADIDAALARLTSPEGMGTLFKVIAFSDPALATLPGFDS